MWGGYKYIAIASRELYDYPYVMDIGKFAVENKMKTNYFRVSRLDKEKNYAALCDEMGKGMRDDTIYFFSVDDTENQFLKDLQCYYIGNSYVIGVCHRE